MDAEVIVAGAGPVGMLAASLLDRAGVRVEVYEREGEPTEQSRATTMHPRTLEVLTSLPTADGGTVADRLVELGRPVSHAHFAALPKTLDYSGLDTPYPFVLMIPQARTEEMLARQLAEQGAIVRRGIGVRGLEQREDHVRVSLSDGTTRTAAYLVGADGAHSTVRQAAGFGFPGTDPDEIGYLGDVLFDEPPAKPVYGFRVGVGSAVVMNLGNGVHRVFGTEAGDTGLTPVRARQRQAERLDIEEVRRMLIAVHGTDFGMRDSIWLTRSGNSTRHADTYRRGRVLLAGDAAHVHLPAGGQGLNVGLQDAANLAWKLVAELAGRAPRHVVEGAASYDNERRRVGELLTANTRAQNVLMSTFTEAGAALRDMVSGFIAQRGEVADELAGWLSGLAVRYEPDSTDPLVGLRAPDFATSAGSLLHVLSPNRFVVLDCTGHAEFASLAGDHVAVLTATASRRDWAEVKGALIRPDGYVAATTTVGADELRAATDAWTSAERAIA